MAGQSEGPNAFFGDGWRWRRPGRQLVAAIACVGLTLVVAAGACGGDDDGNSDDTTTNASADTEPRQTTTTRFTPEEQEVVDAYLAFWEMGVRLAQDPDPDDPEIVTRSTGQAQGDLIDRLTTLRAAKQHVELGPKYAHEVLAVKLDGDSAFVEVCVIDDARLLDTQTEKVVMGEEGVSTVDLEIALVSNGGAWLVDRVAEEDAEAGIGECS